MSLRKQKALEGRFQESNGAEAGVFVYMSVLHLSEALPQSQTSNTEGDYTDPPGCLCADSAWQTGKRLP